jgi:transposase InsO family protein
MPRIPPQTLSKALSASFRRLAVEAFSHPARRAADRFESCGAAKMELFDDIEVFYNQRRRHSTLGQISPAAFERGTAPARDGKDGTI